MSKSSLPKNDVIFKDGRLTLEGLPCLAAGQHKQTLDRLVKSVTILKVIQQVLNTDTPDILL